MSQRYNVSNHCIHVGNINFVFITRGSLMFSVGVQLVFTVTQWSLNSTFVSKNFPLQV